jgi:hypothetical protein
VSDVVKRGFAGFFEGLFAPLGELMISLAFTIGFTTIESTGGDPWMLVLFMIVLGAVDVLRNIIIGLRHSAFTVGHIIGSVFGLMIFLAALASISADASAYSLALTIILIVSFCVGVGVAIYRHNQG